MSQQPADEGCRFMILDIKMDQTITAMAQMGFEEVAVEREERNWSQSVKERDYLVILDSTATDS